MTSKQVKTASQLLSKFEKAKAAYSVEHTAETLPAAREAYNETLKAFQDFVYPSIPMLERSELADLIDDFEWAVRGLATAFSDQQEKLYRSERKTFRKAIMSYLERWYTTS